MSKTQEHGISMTKRILENAKPESIVSGEAAIDMAKSLIEAEKELDKIAKALDCIMQYGGIDGANHKQWTLDQVVRILTGDNYEKWITDYNTGEYGPDTYE